MKKDIILYDINKKKIVQQIPKQFLSCIHHLEFLPDYTVQLKAPLLQTDKKFWRLLTEESQWQKIRL